MLPAARAAVLGWLWVGSVSRTYMPRVVPSSSLWSHRGTGNVGRCRRIRACALDRPSPTQVYRTCAPRQKRRGEEIRRAGFTAAARTGGLGSAAALDSHGLDRPRGFGPGRRAPGPRKLTRPRLRLFQQPKALPQVRRGRHLSSLLLREPSRPNAPRFGAGRAGPFSSGPIQFGGNDRATFDRRSSIPRRRRSHKTIEASPPSPQISGPSGLLQ